jgi:hypothetical protein
VRNPGKTFPRALLLAVVLVVAMYLLPTMAALGIASPDSKGSDWGLGYYGLVAQQVIRGRGHVQAQALWLLGMLRQCRCRVYTEDVGDVSWACGRVAGTTQHLSCFL